jgi:hypothetical protein
VFDPLLGTSERSSTGQGLPQEGEDDCNNFSVNVCVNELPDSSSLQARVCGSTAERLWSPGGSVLWFHGDLHMV